MHVLIVGGTGAAGRVLIRQLQGDGPPDCVSVISRTATSLPLPGVARVLTGHYGDLACSGALGPWLKGVDAVVHLADGLSALQEPRLAADGGHAEALMAGSEGLAGAVRAAGLPLFVYVSSIKALCDESDDRVLTEGSPSRATSLYGRSKLRLEANIARVLAGSDTRLAIVRNPVMYAPAKAGSMGRLLRLADTALPLPLGGLKNRRSLLALANFASALSAIVRSPPGQAGGVFHVDDGPALSTTEIVATLRAALGRPRRLFPVGDAVAALGRHLPLAGPAARRLYGSLQVSDAHFRQTFDWTPAVETKTALAEMAAAHAAARGPNTISEAALRHG
ncbi:MAG: NAD-dependent epimerase/dehydratase family protein [Hyphomicrobiaceae bacterium]|nr:NAD-dependent epimerase/dehydratase family protein [Hyphomicrobiaceae bacterium]